VKRWLSFAVVLGLLAAGLVLSQVQQAEVPAAPMALLYLVADSEHELTRLPMRYTRIPDAEEIRIGDRIAKEFGQPAQDEEGKLIEGYLRAVGAHIAASATRKLPYQFHYIPDRTFINAFAIPGGHVYVGAGLLSLMENEDELAAILGHEIEHIDHYHCAERLQTEAALRKVPLGSLVYIPVAVFQAGYSKVQEAEADREGTRLAVAAGYSPEGAVQVFAEFQKMEEKLYHHRKASTPQEEVSGAAIQILTGYFQSHPSSADRIAEIRALIEEEKWPLGQEKTLAVRYIFLSHQAEDLVAAGKYSKAIETASMALQLHPGHPPALVALAMASCATTDFQTASRAYRELLVNRQHEADQVRAFADKQAAAAMTAKHFADAVKFAGFSLELEPDHPRSLTLLTEAELELGDVDAALESGRKLKKLYPKDGADLNGYAYSTGSSAFAAHNYQRAVRFASYSLELEPGFQPDTESLLARSEFLLGDFRAAADAYRKLIEYDLRTQLTIEPALVSAYADSLGSISNHSDRSHEFRSVVHAGGNSNDDLIAQIKIEEAGLLIIAGNEDMARSLTEGSISFAPERAARLGWWYYRAAKYDAAVKMLYRFLAVRPGDAGLETTLGWVELEQNATTEAVQRFKISGGATSVAESISAGKAIANWRLRHTEAETETALAEFNQLSKEAPEWTNPAWVRALHGPVAAEALQEMYREQQRRMTARKW